MKPANTSTAVSISKRSSLMLVGTLAAVTAMVACSSNSGPSSSSSQPPGVSLRPAALETVAAVSPSAPVAAAEKASSPQKPPASGLNFYRSRDYRVSFRYPWQYAFLNARAVATGDSSLRPKPDGHDGQFTLARIEIPRGFYPGSDLESGYFMLSLNPELDQQQCESALNPGEHGKLGIDTINGVDFRWLETESGGQGSAAKLRNYVTFTNNICYQLELGVKTRNEDGLARELNPDQVFRRLDAILRTIKILPATEPAVSSQVATSTTAPEPMPQE